MVFYVYIYFLRFVLRMLKLNMTAILMWVCFKTFWYFFVVASVLCSKKKSEFIGLWFRLYTYTAKCASTIARATRYGILILNRSVMKCFFFSNSFSAFYFNLLSKWNESTEHWILGNFRHFIGISLICFERPNKKR